VIDLLLLLSIDLSLLATAAAVDRSLCYRSICLSLLLLLIDLFAVDRSIS
jgi:hypothetical protein